MSNTASLSENVKVFVRCRPLLSKELSSASKEQTVTVTAGTGEIILLSPDLHKPGQKVFIYDGVLDYSSDQEQVYELCAFSLVESVFEGYNATIFAYGQTGSGKTYSMMGVSDDEVLKGIIPRSFDHIIRLIKTCTEDKSFFITASYLEIYNEEIHDLLIKNKDNKPPKCELRENPEKGFFVKDLSQTVIHSTNELLHLLAIGNKQRAVGETKMNDKSSRSHTIFGLRVECSHNLGPNTKPRISVGKLNLVDLAGSERQNKTQATDERFKEAVKINLSLSALGNVISALAEGKNSHHIPYRDSKLTKLLQDSLGGNSKTIMLANINPCILHYEETLGTLRYASRTKLIKNKPKMNEDPKDALIRNYMEEIQKLKDMLSSQAQPQMPLQTGDIEKLKSILEEKDKALDKMRAEIKEKEGIVDVIKEKEDLLEKMKEKEDLVEKMRLDKENLEKMLLEKEQMIVKGAQIPIIDVENDGKLEAMRKRIKKQKKIHEDLVKEKESHEEELRLFEHKYASVQEELDALRKSNRELYDKYKASQYEIEDINREHEYEKENLLDSIRELEKDISFYEELADMVFTKEELIKIRGQSLWSDNLNRYRIPPFLFKDKEIKFPNLTHSQGIDLVEVQKNFREMDFEMPEIEQKEVILFKKPGTSEEKKDKEGFLVNQRLKTGINQHHNKQRSVKVRPVKITSHMSKEKEKEDIIEKKPKYQATISIEDMTSPSLAERTKQKKEYLRALDHMIDTYTEKYGKDKIIVPQNMSLMNTMSFTDFKDLDRDLDIQMIKAKKNLNSLLEPLAPTKNESVIQELIEDNPLFRKNPIEKNSSLINKRSPPSPKSVVLRSLQKVPTTNMILKKEDSGVLKKKDSGGLRITNRNLKN